MVYRDVYVYTSTREKRVFPLLPVLYSRTSHSCSDIPYTALQYHFLTIIYNKNTLLGFWLATNDDNRFIHSSRHMPAGHARDDSSVSLTRDQLIACIVTMRREWSDTIGITPCVVQQQGCDEPHQESHGLLHPGKSQSFL